MADRQHQRGLAGDHEDTLCPDCRVNQIEPPFFYCGLCEMLTSYFTNQGATPEQLRNRELFHDAYERWRATLTWAEIERLRDQYWTRQRRRQKTKQA